ncbi:MAG: TetR/AcrR family transcriptional regulator [Muribaculaceae bacterium]|nr:TetR/AcrR family transcriptional regulator [Muribaculaceae bacterium]
MKEQTTEEKILEAAEKEFLQRGFESARTTSIAKEAGVTHAMLHYYFRTKEKLFEKIISDKMSMLGELMLDSLTKSHLPLFEKLQEAIICHLDFINANSNLPLFFIREVYSNPERMKLMATALQTHAKKSISNLQAEIDELAERGECRRVDATMLLIDIVSLNIFSFIAQPVMETVFSDLFSDKERFLELRKRENTDTIMRKLKI